MDDKAHVQSLLKANQHLVLSTADKDGKPWVTPVSYSFDEENSLYWVSSKDALHSSNIRDRKEVAIVIYMTEPVTDAVYIDAEAQELTDETEITSAMKVIDNPMQPDKFRVKSPADASGEAAWRIYKAVPIAMYVREHTQVNDQAVTVRRKITYSPTD